MKIWLDGKLVEQEEAKTSVFDHGTLYGDGIFEGIRFYNKRVFRLEDHMDRLYNCAHYLLLDIPYTQEELSNAVCETVAASGLNDGYIRLVVTRGVGNLGLNPFNCKRSCVFIIADKISLYDPDVYENGLALITSSVRRNRPDTVCPQVKSLNYLNNILAKMEAVRQGAAEALMLNDLGNVAECTGDNIFIVKDGTVFTPPVTDGCLDGITRRVVLEICRELQIPAQEKTMNRKAAEVFLALELERNYTKDEILELYVNSIYFGDGYYNVGEASQGYFGKPAAKMNDYECTLLAGVPNAPSKYAPSKNLALAEKRQKKVISRMEACGYLTKEDTTLMSAELVAMN